MADRTAFLSYDAVREFAQMVGDHHHIYDEAGKADVYGLIEKLGGTVVRDDRPEFLRIADRGSFTVWLPRVTSLRRRRIAAAAAVGRFFLDYLYPELTGELTIVHEQEGRAMVNANVFAATLLMPARQFGQAWTALDGDDWAVARHFDVSPAAARTRAEVLGLIGKAV